MSYTPLLDKTFISAVHQYGLLREIYNEILGKNVQLPDRIEIIVSLNPSVTESLFMMGLGDKVEAVSAFCARPPEAKKKRKIGSYNTLNREILKSIRPDIIFTVTGYQRQLALDLSKEYSAFPLELPATVAGIVDMVTKVGLAVGEFERGRLLSADLLKKLLLHIPEKVNYRPRIYLEIDLGGPTAFGAYSYITDAIHLLGGISIYGDARAEWLTPDLAQIGQLDPDIFIYEAKMYSKFQMDDLERLIDRREWRDMKFVRRNMYFLTPGPLDFFAHHGPSFILEVLPWLRDKLNAFADKSG